MFERPENWLAWISRGSLPPNSLLVQVVEPALRPRLLLPCFPQHGAAHIRRVCLYAEILASQYGADPLATCVAAYCHDCARLNDGTDPGHGARSWQISEQVVVQQFPDLPMGLIRHAIEDHTKGWITEEPLVAALWDSDRIDLMRFGHPPVLEKLDQARLSRPEAMQLAAQVIGLDLSFGERFPADPCHEYLLRN